MFPVTSNAIYIPAGSFWRANTALKRSIRIIIEILKIAKHMIFTGNPGTGKTTIARKLAEIYKELGLLKMDLLALKNLTLINNVVNELSICSISFSAERHYMMYGLLRSSKHLTPLYTITSMNAFHFGRKWIISSQICKSAVNSEIEAL